VNASIENLRLQAERETADASKTRRPSWAPALVLGPDLLDVCRALELLGIDDKPVARLWSIFADPKKLGTWQRENISDVPLHGHRVRGFEMIAGEQRTGSKRLYRTLKGESGYWDEGPRWIEPDDYKIDLIRQLIRRYRQSLEDRISELEASGLAACDDGARHFYEEEIVRQEAALAERTASYERAMVRFRLRKQSVELGKSRLAEFLGDPEAQMLAGSRVTGRCSRCGAELTDPISVERGIGPECIKRVAWHKIVPEEVRR
jgi:hypothetical protein